jgi:hypothetical protein
MGAMPIQVEEESTGIGASFPHPLSQEANKDSRRTKFMPGNYKI